MEPLDPEITIEPTSSSLALQGTRRALAKTGPQHATTWRKVAFATAAGVVPAMVGLALAGRSKRLGLFAGGLTGLLLGVARWQLQRWFTAEPAYELETRIGELELRRYAPHIEARTHMYHLPFEDALDEGFRRLASYIFGGNAKHERLQMSAPVTTRGEEIGMTTPVITAGGIAGPHTMSFVMPAGRDLESLPSPVDDGIELCEVPERRIAVLGFRGAADASHVAEAEQRLLAAVAAAGLTPNGDPAFAGFDPPTTLPLLRRNEVWIEVL